MSRKGCPNKVSKKVAFYCEICGKEWVDFPSRIGKKRFCSNKCRGKSLVVSCRNRSKGNDWGSFRKIDKDYRDKMSKIMKGKIRPNISKAKMGSKNPNWRGGISPINKRIRRSSKFLQWRKKVFERDNYTCQKCGKRGGELHPDHIKQFAYYPELRFELSNGRTLCKRCHMKTETFGFKKHVLPEKQV
jgi:hypothetical protein